MIKKVLAISLMASTLFAVPAIETPAVTQTPAPIEVQAAAEISSKPGMQRRISVPLPDPTPTPTPTPEVVEEPVVASNELTAFSARYDAYQQANPNMEWADVVLRVNLGLDYPNYEGVMRSNNPSSTSVFMSKHYGVFTSWRPDDLTDIPSQYGESGEELQTECYNAFALMSAETDALGLVLYIDSGRRTNRSSYDANDIWNLRHGHSEHQTGLAIDFKVKGEWHRTRSGYEFEKTAEYAWLMENAYRYGFILSYPEDKTDITGIGYEPWHWRYVGVEIATDMKVKGFTTYHEYWATHLIQTEIWNYAS